jgi:hypothetical protein
MRVIPAHFLSGNLIWNYIGNRSDYRQYASSPEDPGAQTKAKRVHKQHQHSLPVGSVHCGDRHVDETSRHICLNHRLVQTVCQKISLRTSKNKASPFRLIAPNNPELLVSTGALRSGLDSDVPGSLKFGANTLRAEVAARSRSDSAGGTWVRDMLCTEFGTV